ncbi:HemK2/MTQ2 family protein methyltransferase [Streptomyces sp. NPDC052236]|uniref:HemK2/MTQ2 family protein methyltransferase n=1 Tax=Streptomyces sp. NPDC052236 TaxID=3365686 RepID=UPI0037D53EA6
MSYFRPTWPWGVYRPQGDSHLLREALTKATVPSGARVLDVCTGTGLIAVTAARLGASRVWAVDTSYPAVLTARCNARLRRLPIRVEHGDFRACAVGRRFDVVTANPPYVPCPDGGAAGTGRARAWNGGPDGRLYVDRLCTMAPRLLSVGGTMLLVHSALCGPDLTLHMLGEAGLKASVVARRRQPFGPVLSARAAWLEAQGLIAPGQREEELVVVRADQPG